MHLDLKYTTNIILRILSTIFKNILGKILMYLTLTHSYPGNPCPSSTCDEHVPDGSC